MVDIADWGVDAGVAVACSVVGRALGAGSAGFVVAGRVGSGGMAGLAGIGVVAGGGDVAAAVVGWSGMVEGVGEGCETLFGLWRRWGVVVAGDSRGRGFRCRRCRGG